jgi:tRNA1(Val) A37 N6-methylase TrmN6
MMIKSGGFLTLIYPADQIHRILGPMSEKMGNIVIYPIWSQKNKAAKRIIISGQKGVKTPSKILPGLVLHQSNGSYSEEAEDILRHAQLINLYNEKG